MKLIEVLIEHRVMKLNQSYHYLAPDAVVPGVRVSVRFNHQKNVAAFVWKAEDYTHNPFSYALSEIDGILDDEPILNQELMDLAQWMADETLAPLVSCVQAMLPRVKQVASKTIKANTVEMVRFVSDKAELTDKQEKMLALVKEQDQRAGDLRKISPSILKRLLDKQLVERYDRQANYETRQDISPDRAPVLSQDQKEAVDTILSQNKRVSCLYGSTGSGKTECYLHLAQAMRSQGRQSLILVPEIALTSQMVERFSRRFNEDVVVYHSGLNHQERYQQYRRVQNNEVSVVVGTRSSVFLPFKDLGLIVLDEEHDHSYKQESLPYYHTRDVAIQRAEYWDAKVVLGSATPSFETYARALKGPYQLVSLKTRIQGELPEIHCVRPSFKAFRVLSDDSINLLDSAVKSRKQAVVLLNRRGYAPIIQCRNCHEALSCPNCDRLLVYHNDTQRLHCHECGYVQGMPTHCPHCQSPHLQRLGYGTKRIEEELMREIPGIKILRLDRDSTQRKNSHQMILDAFNRHEADVLLGTQMVAKGLDNPRVAVSVILDIDRSLLKRDYRSTEDAFSLMVQTAGRAGRKEKGAQVIIETNHEAHPIFKWVKNHQYTPFFNHEMKLRHLGQNPPYTYLIAVNFYHKDNAISYQRSHQMKSYCEEQGLKVLGPSDLGKLNTIYTTRIILKGKQLDEMRQVLRSGLEALKDEHRYEVWVDVNPLGV